MKLYVPKELFSRNAQMLVDLHVVHFKLALFVTNSAFQDVLVQTIRLKFHENKVSLLTFALNIKTFVYTIT